MLVLERPRAARRAPGSRATCRCRCPAWTSRCSPLSMRLRDGDRHLVLAVATDAAERLDRDVEQVVDGGVGVWHRVSLVAADDAHGRASAAASSSAARPRRRARGWPCPSAVCSSAWMSPCSCTRLIRSPRSYGHDEVDGHAGARQLVGDERLQLVDALAAVRRHDDRVHLARPQPGDRLGRGEVGLVEHDDLGHVHRARDVREDVPDGRDLALGVRVRGVDDVQDQVGVGDLLQRRAERLDELVRQRPDEADGVRERVDAAVDRLGAPDGRVERGEQRVLDEHAGVA